MHKDEDIKIEGTMSDYLIQQLTDEEHGKDFAEEYLKLAFLTSAANTLFYMRRQAGLTQAQIAERLNTKQSAVARIEGDFDGGISLRRYVEFALACDMVPHNITFASIESVISYTIAQPKIPFTQVNHQEWLNTISHESVAKVKSNFETLSKVQSEAVFSVETSPRRSSANIITVASSATTLQDNLSVQEYFQPPLLRSFQLLPSVHRTSTASESQDKTSNLAPSRAS